MKARLKLDQFADVSTMPEELRPKLTFVRGRGPNGKPTPVPIFPKGTIFEGEMAIGLVNRGQADPADDECAKACGKSPEQLAALQVDYQMNALGINDKDDRELFRAGVIAGYDKDQNYIHGTNWDAYNAAVKTEEEADDE